MSNIFKGYILVFVGILFWGIAGPIAKYLFTMHYDSFLIIQTRAIFSFIILFLILLVFKREFLKIKFFNFKNYLLMGMIGMAGSNYFYYTSIKFITVATAIMLQYTTPFLVLMYAFIFHLEKFHYIKLFLLFFAFIALFFAISGGDLSYFSVNTIGIVLGILSAFTWAFYNIYNKKIKNRYNNYTELLYIVGSASLLWILINPLIINQLIHLNPNDVLVLLSFAVISVLIPMFCYNSGLKYLKATQATTIGLCEPVVVVFTAFYILGENISIIQAISGFIVLLSIYFLEYFRRRIGS